MNKTSQPLTRLVATFCHELSFKKIPPEVVRAAKHHTLDALGVGLAAASLNLPQQIEKVLPRFGSGEDSTVFGFVEKRPPPSAAFLNGTLIHSLEYDDTHIASVIHGSSAIVPTALAIAESEGLSGQDFIRSIVIGWEFLIRLGLAAPGMFQANGFQTTAVCGPFATALISSALFHLDVGRTVNAMGIAGSQCSGVFEYLSDGSTVKALHPGWAAHSGIIASYLAQGGMTGPATILEGRFGLFNTYARTDSAADRLRELLRGLGTVWYLPEVALKTFPCCHYIHSFLECLQNLTPDGLSVDEVESIQCYVPLEEVPIICEPWERKLRPASGYEAKFSLPYCLAALLIDQEVNVSTFDRDSLKEDVLAMAKKVSYTPLTGTDFPKRFPGSLEVRGKSGRTLSSAVADVKGSPGRPLTQEEVRHKFETNAMRRLSPQAVASLLAEFDRLEEKPNLKLLSETLRSIA
jgi:2-methylcitrate dehydratase PrpD